MKVAVLDASNRVAVAVARGLRREGIRVVACEQQRFAGRMPLAFALRGLERTIVLPEVSAQAVARETRDCDAVLPVSLNSVVALSGTGAIAPDLEKFRRLNDKFEAFEQGRRAGIPVPATLAPRSMQEVENLSRVLGYPTVVKLRTDEGTYLRPEERFAIARSRDEFLAAFQRLHALKAQPIVQEFIPGENFGVGVLRWGGRVYATFAHRRIRELPPGAGPSTMCEAIRDPGLCALAVRLLEAFDWEGVAQVQFRRDARDGQFKVIEVNPRFWGALPLALSCGVNFPAMLVRLWLGQSVSPVTEYRAGKKMRFLVLDALAALKSLATPLRFAYVFGFLRDLLDPSVEEGLFSRRDPIPLARTLFGRVSR